METRKYLSLLAACLCIPGVALGYNTSTHANITTSTFAEYNRLYGGSFTEEEIALVVQGSIDEDHGKSGRRPMNHFYDPVHKQGLRMAGEVTWHGWLSGLASPLWAIDTFAQGNYHRKHLGYHDLLFSAPTDFSWDRAVYEWVHGDKDYALKALGHQVHLVQDATVPAHVRNDAHPPFIPGQKDAYEAFTTNLTPAEQVLRIDVPRFENVEQAVAQTAVFTNKYFFSQDTVLEKYLSPNKKDYAYADGFGVHASLGHKLLRIERYYDTSSESFIETVFFDDPQYLIQADYWRLLSYTATAHGVALIDTFLRAVEQEEKTSRLAALNKSAFEIEALKDAKRLAIGGFDTVKGLYGSSLTTADVMELNEDDWKETADVVAAFEAKQSVGPAHLRNVNQQGSVITAFLNVLAALRAPKIPEPEPFVAVNDEIEVHNVLAQEASDATATSTPEETATSSATTTPTMGGPWWNHWWRGPDQPSQYDPTPGVQKMFEIPIQGVGGPGVGGGVAPVLPPVPGGQQL